jgi:hypothetical protein
MAASMHAAAAEVAHQVERRHRRLARPSDRAERAGDRDVVDVMARGRRQRTLLAPAGHSREDQPGVALRAYLRPEAEALGHSRPEALDQDIGVLGEPQQQVDSGLVLEVEADRAAAAAERIHRQPGVRPAPLGPVHPQHVSAEIGRDHAAERGRRQAGDLDDLYAVQWTHEQPPMRQRCHGGRPRRA